MCRIWDSINRHKYCRLSERDMSKVHNEEFTGYFSQYVSFLSTYKL